MTDVDPFTIPVPRSLSSNPETAPYFEYLGRFLNRIFLRTGGGLDQIEVSDATISTIALKVNEIILAVNELVDDHETFRLASESSNTLTDELRADHAVTLTLTSELKDDIDDIKTALTALLQKMDVDFVDVANASIDYESSITVPVAVAADDLTSITATEATDPPPALTNDDDISSL